MRISIIFHSVSANTYLCAKAFHEFFLKKGEAYHAGIYRVADWKIDSLKDTFPIINEYYDEITCIPLADNDIIKNSDLLIMGSPTYFGNVSSQFKNFLDDTSVFWENSELFGKKFLAFTTAGNSAGGADICLKSLVNYAQHMGMNVFSTPSGMQVPMPAYGLVHYSGDFGNIRPGDNFKRAVEECLKRILNVF